MNQNGRVAKVITSLKEVNWQIASNKAFPCLHQMQPEVVSESWVCLSAGLEAGLSVPQILVYRNPRSAVSGRNMFLQNRMLQFQDHSSKNLTFPQNCLTLKPIKFI